MTAAAWPTDYQRIAPTSRFRFNTTTGLNVSALGGGSAAVSSEIESTAMLKCTTTSGASLEIRYTPSSAFSNPRQSQGLRFYVPDYTKLSSLLFYSGDAGFSNFGNFTYSFASADKQYNGWHYADIYPGGWSVGGGSGFTSAVGDWKVRVIPQASTVASIYLHTLESGQMARPKVILSYDDGYASVWTDTYGIQYANSLGLYANLGIIGEQIDSNATWLTSAQLDAVYAAGNDLAAHGASSLGGMSAAQIAADVRSNIAFLTDRGYTRGVKHYVYPNGVYQISAGDTTIFDTLVGEGVVTARTTSRQVTYSPRYDLSRRLLQVPIVGWLATDTPSGMLAQIDTSILRGHTCVLMFHAIVASGATSTDINSSDHKAILDGIYARVKMGLIDCVRWSDWHRGLTQPTLS